ncbi:protealysin propeptide domain-containing protein [Erwinia aeris]
MHYGAISPYIQRKIIDNGSGLRQSCARQTLAHVQMLMAAQLKGGDC